MTIVQDFRDRLEADRGMNDVQRSLEKTFAPFGLTSLTYIVMRPPVGRQRPRVLTNYPREWINHYLDLDYANVDVLYPAAGESLFPIRWDEAYSTSRASKKERLIFHEAKEFGLSNGVTVPVHGPASGMAALSLAGSLSKHEFESIWRNLHDEMTLIAAYSHQAILAHAAAEENYEPIRLTPRERACLMWTAGGKTAWEIGEILGVQGGTILFHLNNCMRKLNVYSKHHAVVKAIMLGLIAPEV